MNQGILAARTQQALDRIAQETQRLGGLLIIQPTRGDAAHRQLHMLEAIAEALAGIGAAKDEAAGADEGLHEVEPVEAIIAVVAEDEPLAPKARKAK